MLIDELKAAKIKAFKEKDTITKDILGILVSKYQLAEVEARAANKEIGDKELLAIIQKTLKELSDEKEGYQKVGNLEKVNAITKQEEIISSYLPKQLSEPEIRSIIASLEDKSVPSVMKHFKTNYAGQVDMSLVNSILRSL